MKRFQLFDRVSWLTTIRTLLSKSHFWHFRRRRFYFLGWAESKVKSNYTILCRHTIDRYDSEWMSDWKVFEIYTRLPMNNWVSSNRMHLFVAFRFSLFVHFISGILLSVRKEPTTIGETMCVYERRADLRQRHIFRFVCSESTEWQKSGTESSVSNEHFVYISINIFFRQQNTHLSCPMSWVRGYIQSQDYFSLLWGN